MNNWTAALVVSSLTFGAAEAQEWPTRPITMVVPFAAGGPTDIVGRVIAQRLGEILGQSVVVENIGGAGGMTASQRVAQGRPDGYELLLGTVGTHAYNQTLYKRPLYNAERDFTPVALIAEQPLVLVTRKDFPASSLQEFIPYIRANASKLSFGSGGAGSATHLGCVLLNSAIGVTVQHVPYRGSAPAMQDVSAGRIDYLCDAVATAMPQIRAGSVKAIAVLARERAPALADVPTADEQGLPGFEANNWIGLLFPPRTPEAIVRRLHEAVIAAISTPTVRERMQAIATNLVTPERTSPDYFKQFISSEIKKWAAPIRESGVSAD